MDDLNKKINKMKYRVNIIQNNLNRLNRDDVDLTLSIKNDILDLTIGEQDLFKDIKYTVIELLENELSQLNVNIQFYEHRLKENENEK